MGRLPGRSPWPACACRTCRRFLRRSPWLWLAPDGAVVPEQGGLLHSVYSTEMFPWRLFKTSERELLRRLVGPDVEHLVFLYCTCSQQQLYREVHRLSAAGKDLAAGLYAPAPPAPVSSRHWRLLCCAWPPRRTARSARWAGSGD
jgi:hypothetical protein